MKVALRIARWFWRLPAFWRALWPRAPLMMTRLPGQPECCATDLKRPRRAGRREHTDAVIRLLKHDRSERAAHGGRLSEHFHFESGPGSQFFVSYATPKIPVSDDLRIGLYVRSDRAGVRIPRQDHSSGRRRSGYRGSIVRAYFRNRLRSGGPMAETRARADDAADRAAGPGAAGLDAAAGQARRSVRGAGRRESTGRARRVGGVSRRSRDRGQCRNLCSRDRRRPQGGRKRRVPRARSRRTTEPGARRRLSLRSASSETCSRSEGGTAFSIHGFPLRSTHPARARELCETWASTS